MEVEARVLLRRNIHGRSFEAAHLGILGGGTEGGGQGQQYDKKQLFHRRLLLFLQR